MFSVPGIVIVLIICLAIKAHHQTVDRLAAISNKYNALATKYNALFIKHNADVTKYDALVMHYNALIMNNNALTTSIELHTSSPNAPAVQEDEETQMITEPIDWTLP